MSSFKGKTVWITGASSGFGEALAKAFSEQGAKLILSARRVEALNQIKTEIGENAYVLPLDQEKPEEFKAKTQEALQAFGTIDILINNGGIAQRSMALQTTLAIERRIFEVDFFSYVELTRCLLPHFIEKKSGQIVVVSGALARIHLPGRTAYCGAKAALHGYFGSLRNEVGRYGVDITLLVPGAMATPLVQHALTATGEATGATGGATGTGFPVAEAAHQALEAIDQKRYEVFIGKKDKTAFMMCLARHFPTFFTGKLLRQSSTS